MPAWLGGSAHRFGSVCWLWWPSPGAAGRANPPVPVPRPPRETAPPPPPRPRAPSRTPPHRPPPPPFPPPPDGHRGRPAPPPAPPARPAPTGHRHRHAGLRARRSEAGDHPHTAGADALCVFEPGAGQAPCGPAVLDARAVHLPGLRAGDRRAGGAPAGVHLPDGLHPPRGLRREQAEPRPATAAEGVPP